MSKFERRLYVGFAILVALFTPILVGAFFVISQLEDSQNAVLTKNAEDVIRAERMETLINEEFAMVEGYVLRGSPKSIADLDHVHQQFQLAASDLLRTLDKGESPDLVREIQRLEDETYQSANDAVALKNKGATFAQIGDYFRKENMTRSARVLLAVHEEKQIQTDQLNEARAHRDHVSNELVWGLIIACGFAIFATAAVVFLMFQLVRNKMREDRQRDEKLKLQEKLSTARKQAVEVVAHDLKNPLSSIRMSMELLRDDLSDVIDKRPDVATGLHIAERSVLSMQHLIDDQLDHTKIEAGQLVVEKVPTDLTELLGEVELRFRPLVAAKHLNFIVQVEDGLRSNCDPARIEQVLSNLIGNALKFTPSGGGAIEVRAKRVGDWISIIVSDTGPGIAEDALEHVFERYWQARETSKKGTGLGLSIAKGIVEAHGGKLLCRSQLGHGAEFEIRLLAATAAIEKKGPPLLERPVRQTTADL